MVDNVRMADLDPVPILEAVTGDPRLRVFVGGGRIQALPARHSRRLALLEKIAQAFEPGVRYPERDVSLFLGALHADYAALRRYLVDADFLSRDNGEYWRSGGDVPPSAQPGSASQPPRSPSQPPGSPPQPPGSPPQPPEQAG
jgi:hypothetical protein